MWPRFPSVILLSSSFFVLTRERSHFPLMLRTLTCQWSNLCTQHAILIFDQIPMAVAIQPMALVGPEEIPVSLVDFGEAQRYNFRV